MSGFFFSSCCYCCCYLSWTIALQWPYILFNSPRQENASTSVEITAGLESISSPAVLFWGPALCRDNPGDTFYATTACRCLSHTEADNTIISGEINSNECERTRGVQEKVQDSIRDPQISSRFKRRQHSIFSDSPPLLGSILSLGVCKETDGW